MLRIQIFFVLLLGWVSVKAQNTLYEDAEDQSYRTAIELLQKQKFGAARQAFDQYVKDYPESLQSEDARYYRAYCALNLFHPDAESLYKDFVDNFDYHPKASFAYFELGNFYFKQEDYQKSTEYFEQVPLARLDKSQQSEARFKLAYGYFAQQQFDQALREFNQIKTSDSKYSAAASYYAGYIEYRNQNYDQALVDLERAKSQQSYARLVPFLVANVYYKQGRYDELLEYVEAVIEDNPNTSYSDLYLLAGEAHYFKKDYQQAAEYYQAYSQKSKRKLPPDTQYKQAFTQYAIGNLEQAEIQFKSLVTREEEVGQFASYYLGEVYLKQENPKYAAPAYLKASRDTYNSNIKESAAFKHAKVQYDLGNYAQAVVDLQQFLEAYPNSEFHQEAGDLLSEAYLKTNDYDQAILHLEQIDNKSARAQKTYQQVTYFRGTEYFNNAKYRNAVEMFKKSLTQPIDPEIEMLANYWSAEAYSVGKKYSEAITSYQNVLRVQELSDHEKYIRAGYGLGYAYFNTNEYARALEQFNNFLAGYSTENRFREDALIRSADCHYALKDYQAAITKYQEAISINSHDRDYALLQQGTILSITGEQQQARQSFNTLIAEYPKSRFADDAVYQRAQLDLESGQYQQASTGFTKLIGEFPNSDLIPYAYTKRALAYYNLKQYQNTLNDYQTVLQQYINHESANDALIGMQETLNLLGRSDEFESYFTKYKAANPDNSSLVNIEYESAVNLYLSQDYQKAISKFEDFIANHPAHQKVYEARFFLAESFYRINQDQEAISYYQQVVEENRIAQVNRARRRLGDLWFEDGDYDAAVLAYQELESAAQTKKENYYAWSGLMESYLRIENYQLADQYAARILEQGAVNLNASNRSMVVRGNAAYQMGDTQTAMDHFISALNTAQDENGAEAQYMLAQIQYDQQQYTESNETLYDLNNKFGTYGYWLGKSFLLISDNYLGLNEEFQARATLTSIIENAPEQEIVAEAKQKLALLDETEDTEQIIPEDSLQIEIIDEGED